MKVEIYDVCKEEKKIEEPLRLKFEQYGTSIRVIAVNKEGKKLLGGNLLRFTDGGKLILSADINSTVPVQTDGNGRIRTT